MKPIYTILAISFKADRLGIAVFNGQNLTFYQMVGLCVNRNKRFEIARYKIQSFIDLYHPQIVAVETMVYVQQKTIFLGKLFETISNTAKRKNISVKTYSINAVRQYLCQNQKPIKDSLVNALIYQYPELKKFAQGQNIWQKSYSMPIFSAVALGLYCLDIISRKDK